MLIWILNLFKLIQFFVSFFGCLISYELVSLSCYSCWSWPVSSIFTHFLLFNWIENYWWLSFLLSLPRLHTISITLFKSLGILVSLFTYNFLILHLVINLCFLQFILIYSLRILILRIVIILNLILSAKILVTRFL